MRRLFYSDDDFGGLFREKLNGHQEEPSRGLWDKIDRELSGKKEYPKKIHAIWWMGGFVFCTVSVLLFINFILPQHNDPIKHLTSKANTIKQVEITVVSDSLNNQEARKNNDTKTQNQIVLSSQYTLKTKIEKAPYTPSVNKHTMVLSPLSLKSPYYLSDESISYALPINSVNEVIEPKKYINEMENRDVKSNTSFSKGILGRIKIGYGQYWMLTNTLQKNPNMTASYSPAMTVQAGLGYRINNVWSFETGINLTSANVNYQATYPVSLNMRSSGTVQNKISLLFLQAPVLVNYNLTKDSNHTIELQAGYVISKFISGKTITDDYTTIIKEDDIKLYQQALTLGVESGVQFSKLLSVRYGLSTICNTSTLTTKINERLNDLYYPVPFMLQAHVGILLH